MDDKTKLAIIIKDNPAATAIIDNDSWYLEAKIPDDYRDWTKGQQDYWAGHQSVLAVSSDYPELGISYGFGLLEAMALICNINIEMI